MKSHGKSKAVLSAIIFEVNLLQSSRFGEANRFGKQKTPAPKGAGVSNAQKRLTWKPLQRGLLRSSSEQP